MCVEKKTQAHSLFVFIRERGAASVRDSWRRKRRKGGGVSEWADGGDEEAPERCAPLRQLSATEQKSELQYSNER